MRLNLSGSLLLVALLAATSLPAATIELKGGSATRMALIDQQATKLSWAGGGRGREPYTNTELAVWPGRNFLMAFDLGQIPAGQRIVQAELRVPLSRVSGTAPRLFLWRMVAGWGTGVCWEARQRYPEVAGWVVPGGLAPGLDRSVVPSVVAGELSVGELTLNVTDDVALWYAGVSPNHGWMFTADDPGVALFMRPPFWDAASAWSLQLTYEPEVEE